MARPRQTPPAPGAPDGAWQGDVDILYQGLARPATLERAEVLLATLSAIVSAWPVALSARRPGADPFATLRPLSDTSWQIDKHMGDGTATLDPVNAVCDFVAEISWERLRSRPDLLSLHAAAVDFSGRLVLFPAARRSGKSTLAAALARRGHRLFSDDFVPVEIDPVERTIRGLANGIAPRLRLPLPEDSSEAFRAWVAADPGPENRQYKYVSGAPLAGANEALPLGAVVVLDRQEGAVAPRLEPIDAQDVLARLILQNFARSLHAGRILKSIEAMVAGLPSYRLSYSSFEAAADFLQAAPELAALPPARFSGDLPETLHAVLPEDLAVPEFGFDPGVAYVQCSGLTETGAGDDRFLADVQGTAIHRLNPGSTLIWRLLEEPLRLDDVVAVMAEIHPTVDPARIHADAERTMRGFLAARLIVPAEG